MHEQMTLEVLLNPSVRQEDEIRLSRQARKIVKRLTDGFLPAPTNADFGKIALKYTSRLSEIRDAVEAIGLQLVAKDQGEGLWEYEIQNGAGKRQVGQWIIDELKARSKRPIAWD
jgi:hypothetical protein